MITKNETQKVIKSANFLNDKGYAREIEESTISFLGDGVNFIITFERYSDVSVRISLKKNEKIRNTIEIKRLVHHCVNPEVNQYSMFAPAQGGVTVASLTDDYIVFAD